MSPARTNTSNTGPKIGQRLGTIMSEFGYNTNDVAKLSGVKQSEIWRIIKGERQSPAIDIVRAIERGLDLPRGALEVDPKEDESLESFLKSKERKALQPPLSPAEIRTLRILTWTLPGENVSNGDWKSFVETRRKLDRK